ncbi:MAG TPA: hypothetical protein VGI32_12810 [Steroidobacteraceae bacterium]
MDNPRGDAATAPLSEQSAVQNTKSPASTLKLVVLWLAVGIPMLWGIAKAFEDGRNFFP